MYHLICGKLKQALHLSKWHDKVGKTRSISAIKDTFLRQDILEADYTQSVRKDKFGETSETNTPNAHAQTREVNDFIVLRQKNQEIFQQVQRHPTSDKT